MGSSLPNNSLYVDVYRERAIAALTKEIEAMDGRIQEQDEQYVWASFGDGERALDFEFIFPDEDNIVDVRFVARTEPRSFLDKGRIARYEACRLNLRTSSFVVGNVMDCENSPDLTVVWICILVGPLHTIIRKAEELRNALRWVPVPILRNRQRVLFGVF